MPKHGFNLNWGYAENCVPDPQPEEGVCTFMGMPTSSHSGHRLKWPEDRVRAKKAALDIMRKHGYRCETPPKGWVPTGEKLEEGKDEELQYLQKACSPIEVMGEKTDNVEFQLSYCYGWLYIRCNSQEAKEFVEDHIDGGPHYQLGLIEHEEERSEIISEMYNLDPALAIVRRTGGRSSNTVGSSFELQMGPKTIAKALCSYMNGEMSNSGPTIELFEVAGECRRKGYGKILLNEITVYYDIVFNDQCRFTEPINFNVSYCTDRHASIWFMRQGFENWDGLGEELGKYLNC